MNARLIVLAVLVAAAFASNNITDFTCNCKSSCCTYIPSDGSYYLTSFCDSSVACGGSCGNCKGWYATSAMRFGCNKQLKCSKSGYDSVTLKVIDSGPACWVEEKAGRSIIDASYSTCQHFAGSNSCGWSDRISITCAVVSAKAMVDDSMLGPCAETPEDAKKRGLPLCPRDEDCYFP